MSTADRRPESDEPGGTRSPVRKARILFVENDVGYVGGSTRGLLLVVRHLDHDRFHPIVTFSRGSENPMIPDFEAAGCEILRVGGRHAIGPTGQVGREPIPKILWLMLRRGWVDVFRTIALCSAIRRLDVDLVHTNNNLRVSRWGIWAAALTGRPLVSHQRFRFKNYQMDILGSRLIDRLLCISKFVRGQLSERVAPTEIRLVYDGCEVPLERPVREGRTRRRKVAVIGRLVRWKGQHLLIEAVPEVLKAVPDAHFFVVGESPDDIHTDYEQGLRERVSELGIDANVEFLGHVYDVERRIREEFDVVVHTSIEAEPFGLIVAEAMAAGCPVIVSDAGGPAEIVEHELSGLHFEMENVPELADRIIRFLTEPEFADAMESAGFERVSRVFNVERTAAEIMVCYDELLGAERTV